MESFIDSIGGAGVAQGQRSSDQGRQDVGQDEFLELMLAQFENQDPMQPLENSDFLAQLAQFSTATGVKELKSSVEGLVSSLSGNRGLAAAQLVGREVMVPSDQLHSDGGAAGAVELPASGELTVQIRDASGQVLRTLDLGTRPPGVARFEWDGLSAAGDRLPPGAYDVTATLAGASGETQVPVLASGAVTGVDPTGAEPRLDVAGHGTVGFGDVRQIR